MNSFPYILILVCILSVQFCVSQNKFEWDFFLYVARWPETVAKFPLPHNVTSFVLHGVWPERNDGTWPQNCPGERFSAERLDGIRHQLDEAWPDLLKMGNSTALWKHEWSKHGTCACNGDVPSMRHELDYFTQCIKWHDELAVRTALTSSGFTPGNSYHLSELQETIAAKVGMTPMLTCDKYRNESVALMRVEFCFGKDLRVQQCPSALVKRNTQNNHCGKPGSDPKILWPKIQHE